MTLDGTGLAAAGTWIRDVGEPGERRPIRTTRSSASRPCTSAPPRSWWPSRPSACSSGGATTTGARSSWPSRSWRSRSSCCRPGSTSATSTRSSPSGRSCWPSGLAGRRCTRVLAAANFANLYGILTLPFYENPGLGPMLGRVRRARSPPRGGLPLHARRHARGDRPRRRARGGRRVPRPAPRRGDRRATRTGARGEAEPGRRPGPRACRRRSVAPLGRGGRAPAGCVPGRPARAARRPARPSHAGPSPAGAGRRRRRSSPRVAEAPRRSTGRRASSGRAAAASTGSTSGSCSSWSSPRCACGPSGSASPCGCTSTRSITPAPRPSSCRTGSTASRTRSTSTPTRTSPSTRSRRASTLFGDNRVVAESDLGTPVRDAALEPRWDEPFVAAGDPASATSGGDRLYVATGEPWTCTTSDPRAAGPVPDRRRRRPSPSTPTPTRRSWAPATGEILVMDTAVPAADLGAATARRRAPPRRAVRRPRRAGDQPVEHLWAAGTGDYVIAGLPDDELVTFDAATAAELSRAAIPGRADVVDAGRVDALVATPAEVPDPAAAAAEVARLVGGDEADYRGAPRARRAAGRADHRAWGPTARPLDAAIADGTLARDSRSRTCRGSRSPTRAGVTFVEPASGKETGSVPLDAPATGIVQVEGLDAPTLYAATGSSLAVIRIPTAERRRVPRHRPSGCPARSTGSRSTPRASSSTPWGGRRTARRTTVYVVEPRGNAVFADAPLPFAPTAWAIDARRATRAPTASSCSSSPRTATAPRSTSARTRSPGGSRACSPGRSWPAFLYLLARILFRRRVDRASWPGSSSLADGMLFVQSPHRDERRLRGPLHRGRGDPLRGDLDRRLALAGRLLGRPAGGRRSCSAWPSPRSGSPCTPSAASALLILLRSALGRMLIVIGLGAIAASLGYMAIASPGPESTGNGNVLFLLLMIGLTLVAAAVAVLHPIAWTVEEVRIAVGGPAALGASPSSWRSVRARAARSRGRSAAARDRVAIGVAVGADGPRRRRGGGVLAGGPARLRAARAAARGRTTRPRSWSRPSRRRRAGCGPAGWPASRSSGRPSACSPSRWPSTSSPTCRGPRSATRSCPAGRRATRARPWPT